jgi:hypothetical protein
MVTIGQMFSGVQRFLRPVRGHFSRPAWRHFQGLLVAMTVAEVYTVDRLTRLLRRGPHRTKHGEFLWQSVWDESAVLQAMALEQLKRLYRKRGGPCYLILDETQVLKQARRMEAVGGLYHHATGRLGRGHTILKACLWYRGVTIPWGSWLYVKKDQAPRLKQPFRTMVKMAASVIRSADLPSHLRVVVLFDAYYLCRAVVRACRAKQWHFIGVGRGNRVLWIEGQKKRLDVYGRNVLRRSGRWQAVTGYSRPQRYQLASRVGWVSRVGRVKVVFSRRRGDRRLQTLVTDDVGLGMAQIVSSYLKRWAIEVLIKDQKQHLGLGDYRVRRYRAVVRHLHLVDGAYACLTHLALTVPGAQGRDRKTTVLRLPPVSHRKALARQLAWQQALRQVIRHSHERPVLRRLEKLLAA